ncbi:unnamed protein product (macronuclear) [Paramecium tetraurelia]|uniref:VWFA domain-containing protein n=1 Tax=Paramecium tetraurelia TaxID=5888 RepID=A0BZ45_PARTE|nr:uncharacterized protein GSPATT00033665001 [Paramecium tetraurelia]CAK63812.1 unnamed protein product [Paramecium tetraurelia]|eukprot:XP_001431210.1 hypothetical protein (macronuclear) [Paramecium tetraurelia strain d4-2]
MIQQQAIEVYMAKQGKAVQSYLITLVDGTGSMNHEYETIIKAHQATFSDLGNQKMDYQWEQALYSFLPYRSAGSGNISNTFNVIFEKLLSGGYPKNITFLFVSDGREHFEINEVSAQIKIMKEKFLIQFICVAVGDQFPGQISMTLREQIHNQNETCPAVFKVTRGNQPVDVLYKEFSEIFIKVRQLLNVQEKHFETNQPVYQTLVQQKPTTQVAPNEPFFRMVDEQTEPIKLDNEVINPTDKPSDISKLITISVEKELILTASDPQHNYKEAFNKIADLGQKILDQTKFEKDENDDIKKQASSQIFLATNIAEGNLELKKTEKEMTDLQKDIRDPVKILDFVEKNAQEINEQELTDDKVKKRMQGQFNNTKLGCFVRSKTTKKELDLVESIWSITEEGLKNYKKVIEKDPKCNLNKLLTDLKGLIDKQLIKIFEKQSITELLDKHISILRELNDTLKDMDKLIKKQDKVKANEVIQFINIRAKPISENNIYQTGAIFDQTDEFEYLPKSIQIILRDDEEELERMVLLLFDDNVSMANEIQAAKSKFLQVFSRLPETHKLAICWRDRKFSLLENNQQQFDTLYKLIETQQQAYDLEKQVDGKTDYDLLHKAIKEIKQKQYLIKLIYITVGSQLKTHLEDVILTKFRNREVKGKPLIKVIPRTIATMFQTNDSQLKKSTTVPKLDEQFIKVYDDILDLIVKEKNPAIKDNQF